MGREHAALTPNPLLIHVSSGEVIKVTEMICWRSLEGRPCHKTSELEASSGLDVVILPIPHSKKGQQKKQQQLHNEMRDCKNTQAITASPVMSIAEETAVASTSHKEESSQDILTALLDGCLIIDNLLSASGIKTTIDGNMGMTPGEKFHIWEQRGIPLRVEIGKEELSTASAKICIHPCNADDSTCISAAISAFQQKEDFQIRDTNVGRLRSNQKFTVPLTSIASACLLILDSLHQHRSAPACAVPDVNIAAGLNSWKIPLCTKLHLFRQACAPSSRSSSSSSSTPSAVQQSADAAGRNERTEAMGESGLTLTGAAQLGESGLTLTGATQLGESGLTLTGAAQLAPCLDHLKHLLGSGKQCHCGCGHLLLSEFKKEMSNKFRGQYPHLTIQRWSRKTSTKDAFPSATGQVLTSSVVNRRASSNELVGSYHEQLEDEGGVDVEEDTVLGSCALFVSNIPLMCSVKTVKDNLAQAFSPFARDGTLVRVHTSRTRHKCTLGWARVTLPSQGAALTAIAALDGKLYISTKSLHVDRNTGGRHEAKCSSSTEEGMACIVKGEEKDRVPLCHGQIEAANNFSDAESSGDHTCDATPSLKLSESSGHRTYDATPSLKLSAPLQVSFCTGRADTLFPHIPYLQRRLLRIDAVAAFSVTDHYTASKMSEVLKQVSLLIFEVAVQVGVEEGIPHPSSKPGGLDRKPVSGLQQPQPSHSSEGKVMHLHGSLLDLTVTDGTACCGGNTLTLLTAFRHVNAVELDADRCQDLCHNLQVLGHRPRQCHFHAEGGFESDLNTNVPEQAFSYKDGLLPSPNGTVQSSSTALITDTQLQGSNKHAYATARGSSSLNVVCGDYTVLRHNLHQDIVFLDPPWGGPQYRSLAPEKRRMSITSPLCTSSYSASCPTGVPSDPSDLAMEQQQRQGKGCGSDDLMLGSMTVSELCADLLYPGVELEMHHVTKLEQGTVAMSGSFLPDSAVIRMVAIKLPSKIKADVFFNSVASQIRGRLKGAALQPYQSCQGGCLEGFRWDEERRMNISGNDKSFHLPSTDANKNDRLEGRVMPLAGVIFQFGRTTLLVAAAVPIQLLERECAGIVRQGLLDTMISEFVIKLKLSLKQIGHCKVIRAGI
ncbi:hypothetical protein CEUSTIGMA_g2074.t1 [Chlamydomonas eustigma]|uniref:Trimethylguanosine synthase n=1 Tax=Chlamydomonas eustigma TaxID=1157962 RepID=A0A250WV47_9CHLO|nr:hypothetical protein CEUSTIGMA_g2074.t1 [Chlamydomonas eustigma]|eukprot:GAX74626.1 hypothetical protein CEUSTIGMA_g2074.t1 [Chlamydomonas eustigma]